MSTTSIPKTGFWTDYSTGRNALVTSSLVGFWLASLAGVWLALSVKYITDIISSFALYSYLWLNPPLRRDEQHTEATNLIASQEMQNDRDKRKEMAKMFRDVPGIRDLLTDILWNQHLSWYIRWRLGAFTAAVLVTALAIVVGGIYSQKITTDGPPALLASDDCGVWLFNERKHTEEQASRAGVVDLQKEIRAAGYAQNCYRASSTFDAAECDVFYHQSIPVNPPIHTQDCPFSSDVCTNDTTIKYVTNTLDSSYIGINSPHAPKFRKSITCSPLSMEERFIRNVTVDGKTRFRYYYGARPSHYPPVEYTYETAEDPYDTLVPAYDVFTYTTGSTDASSYWKPIPELQHPHDNTLTIVFVSSLGIIYKGRSVDPLFPADEEVMLPGHDQPLFRNSNPRARPFACVDDVELCLSNGVDCWPLYGKSPDDNNPHSFKFPPEFWLMYASFLKSSIFYSMVKRLGRSLLAQNLVSGYQSQELPSDHWEKEIQNLFATSLARSQFDAWSIATAEDKARGEKDGYFQVLDIDLCGLYKFRPVSGYVSIDLVTLIFIGFSTIVAFILSRKAWSWTRIVKEFTERSQALRSFQVRQALGISSPEGSSVLQNNPGTQPSPDLEAQTTIQSPPGGSSTAIGGSPSTQVPEGPDNETQLDHDGPIQEGEGVASRQSINTTSSDINYGTMATSSEREATETTNGEDITWEPLLMDILIYCGWFIISWILWILFKGVPRAFHAVVALFRNGQSGHQVVDNPE